MKHNNKVTATLIAMFLITQLIGLFIITIYANGIEIPYGMQSPGELDQTTSVVSLIISFIIAITLFILLTRLKAQSILRIWFLVVVTLALGLSLTAVFSIINMPYPAMLALLISAPFAYIKIFKGNLIIHNLTELLIYPGIAIVFVQMINIPGIIILLFAISIYDMWAVWKSEVMQKMAKYQIDHLKVFTGFFVPYASKKDKEKIKNIKQKYSNKDDKFIEEKLKKSNAKVNLAILGGGDIIFPIITAGVFYSQYLSIYPSLIIIASATIALSLLFALAKKGKFYPAMPFLTAGLYLGMLVSYLVF